MPHLTACVRRYSSNKLNDMMIAILYTGSGHHRLHGDAQVFFLYGSISLYSCYSLTAALYNYTHYIFTINLHQPE